MVGQYLLQINKKYYSVLQCPVWFFSHFFRHLNTAWSAEKNLYQRSSAPSVRCTHAICRPRAKYNWTLQRPPGNLYRGLSRAAEHEHGCILLNTPIIFVWGILKILLRIGSCYIDLHRCVGLKKSESLSPRDLPGHEQGAQSDQMQCTGFACTPSL